MILSCNTGQGHNAAGKALLEALRARGEDAVMEDTLSFGTRNTSRNVSNTYINIARSTPRVFGTLYRAGDLISSDKLKSPVYLANMLYADKLERYILQGGFDTVLSPHLFPAEALTHLRRRHGLRVRSYGVATDYTCTPFWEETDVDVFFIPHEDLRAEYEHKGFAPGRLIATGIPVSARFCADTPRGQARARLGLPAGGRVFLVMTGSMGFGEILDTVAALLAQSGEDARVLVMAGHNDKLRAAVAERFPGDARAVGVPFTTEVPLYMDACDVLLSKPGGLSSTEAAVKNVPLVHTAPIPGCETRNAAFFSSRGMSVSAFGPAQAAQAALALAASADRQQAMLQAQRSYINPRAAEDICRFILA